jgi:hypothetical protein
MTLGDLVEFFQRNKFAVQASVSSCSSPQAAVVGVAVTDRLELVFDTLETTRKAQNLRSSPRIALVVWHEAQTVQYEGIADEPRGDELVRLKQLYFAAFPDGREREAWPGITYFRVRPIWIRYSDFQEAEPKIVEFQAEELGTGT